MAVNGIRSSLGTGSGDDDLPVHLQLQIHTSRAESEQDASNREGEPTDRGACRYHGCAFVGMTVGADESPGIHGWRNDGSGRFDSVTAGPTEWGPEKNICWKTPLPHRSNASPVFVQGRLADNVNRRCGAWPEEPVVPRRGVMK